MILSVDLKKVNVLPVVSLHDTAPDGDVCASAIFTGVVPAADITYLSSLA
jgi:hypothetical protein